MLSSFSGSKKSTQSKKKRTQSSMKWTQRHEKDPYVKRAKAEGSPSRAIFKLEELETMAISYMKQQIKKKHKNGNDTMHLQKQMFQPQSTVLDLGAAPGGWSKYVAEQKLNSNGGLLISVDLLELDDRTVNAIERDLDAPEFHFIQGDFTADSIKIEILDLLSRYNSKGVQCIISDMAANFTGDNLTDALRTMNLCEDALVLAAGPSCFDERYVAGSKSEEDGILKHGGTFLCKYFGCGKEHEKDLKDAVGRHFEFSTSLKPKASRKESAELFLFASGYKGNKPI
jgi:23S rRNA (uridine2552-2'-O)-methyltransferase